ncbi:MAG: ribonuclease P protein component [Candidatus Eisenbacteria bacterium]
MVERIDRPHRLTTTRDWARMRGGGNATRGRHVLVVTVPVPGDPTRVGFVASRRGVGNAVQRNRARRRIREIVRRRWDRMPHEGLLIMLVASRTALTAAHQDLASDIERVLITAGALAPPEIV